MEPIDIAVLVSGSGSNLQALIDTAGPYRIALVVADRPRIRALERAEAAGIPTRVIPWSRDRESFTADVCRAVSEAGAELVVLAGFMRILSPLAVQQFPGRILNIHPSLLPAFPGTAGEALGAALEHGVKLTGVTVHLVDEQVDQGPIVAQVAVPVLPGDTRESLHARIQTEEHRIYPEVVAAFARGDINVEGRTVEWRRE